MKTTFKKDWQIVNTMDIKEICDRVFLFQFDSRIEKMKVFLRWPWSFNKALKELEATENFEEPNVQTCPFWIQCHCLPLGAMNEKISVILGPGMESRGLKVNLVDTNYGKSAIGKWLRFRINLVDTFCFSYF